MAADCTELLYPCRQALIQAMDPNTRSAWRLVNTQTCLDVYESTRSLTWGAPVPQHGSFSNSPPSPTGIILPVPLLSKCLGLEKLQCGGMTSLLSLDALQLPHGLQLEVLDLGQTGIRGCRDFSPLTRCCTPEGCQTLQELHLGGNALGPEGAVALAPALQALTRLRHLDMQSNALGPEGAAALVPALRALTGLERLVLWHNQLGAQGSQGAAALVPALQALSGLKELDLGNNGLGPEGAAALLPALQALTGLQELDLRFNIFDLTGAPAAAALVHALHEGNPQLLVRI